MRWLTLSLAGLCLLLGSRASALELGAIELTKVNARAWQARIAVIDSARADPSTFKVNLASPAAHTRAGINPATLPIDLSLKLTRDADNAQIVVHQPDSDYPAPIVEFLLTLSWPEGDLSRRYAVNLTESPLARATAPSRFGPTKPTDTLYSIANALRPSAIGTNQMMLALLAENPRAFNAPNVNALQRGALLEVPPRRQLRFPELAAANREITAQINAWNQAEGQMNTTDASPSQPLRVLAPEPEPEPEPDPEPEPEPTPEPQTQQQLDGLATQMTRVEASAERLEAENAELQAMLIGVQNDVEQLEALLAQTRATPSAAPAATTATASDALNEQAIKAWVAQQWALALANPNAAFEQPLVRWVASASAGVLGLMLLTLLMARRRRGRDKTAAELPTHWRPGNARSSNNRPDDTVVASAAQSSVDPLEQASSLIAYGQLDQAQSVLDEALGEAPESIDLRVKLLDILTMREDRAGFEAEAHVLHAQLDDEDDPRWQRVARQGRDLAGKNHPLFAITSSDTPDKE